MCANPPTWTDERVELMKRCFAAGLSCRQIAGEIGVSRNAVIGKLSRLNLTRDDGHKARRPTQQDAANGRSPKAEPRRQYQMLKTLYEEPQPAGAGELIDDAHCCSLLELSELRCRWPISSPGAEDFRFCGNTPSLGLPYCAGHTRLAYRPGSRVRIAAR
jgi:GcrA cell cycle regulator